MAWTMRLTIEEQAALTRHAAVEGRSSREIVRDAIRLYLMRHRQ
ncbi:ribbon-helix-helix protein, CopG family [Nocardia noduli]|nr:ribbon-helix-helix protein, CopG family [Nocardia noduli]